MMGDYFVRDALVPFVVELGKRRGRPSMLDEDKLLRLAEMAEADYADSRDPRQLSALSIARLAVQFFIWTDRDYETGVRLLECLRHDFALSHT